MKVRLGPATCLALARCLCAADPASLVSGDPLVCFNRMDGDGTMTRVSVSGMPFATAMHVKTGAVPDTANAWDIRPRCFATLAAQKDDVVVAAFWMRTTAAPAGIGSTTFVVERTISPYTKSVSWTASTQGEWTRFEIPFTMAETYAAGGYNLSFWVTFPNQEVEIAGFGILDYGPNVPFSQLGLTGWPYAGHETDAPWRAEAAARIEQYRKGDIVVVARDDSGNPIAGASVRVKMKRHAFGFGTAVAGDVLQRSDSDGQRYRDAIKTLFNKVVTENALKWPPFESWGRAQDDFMLPWFAANGIRMVRGHNVIWPSAQYLPQDVQQLLRASPVDQKVLRARINDHIAQVMAYTKGKLIEWDVLNEPYTNKDLQKVLGDAEMAAWFQAARAADPDVKLYINDYNILEAGGSDLPHINGYSNIIRRILDAGGPIDGIGLQSHFTSNLTAPVRVLELLDRFAGFGKELQITEFDINVGDEQLQADYTRDFLTACFSHPAVRGFLMWGFWEGAHWLPRGAMIRRDWTTKPNYDVWNDLVFHQWWTDVSGTTGPDGVYRTRGFLGDYDVEITSGGDTRTLPLTVDSTTQPAYAAIGKRTARRTGG
jgi:GH35 family endo-1,4-beta-xylanase